MTFYKFCLTAFGFGFIGWLTTLKRPNLLLRVFGLFRLMNLMGAMTEGLVAQHYGWVDFASGFITLAIVILSAKFALFKSNQDLKR